MAADGTEAVKLSQFKAALAGGSGGNATAKQQILEFTVTPLSSSSASDPTFITIENVFDVVDLRIGCTKYSSDPNATYSGFVLVSLVDDIFSIDQVYIQAMKVSTGMKFPFFQFDIVPINGYDTDSHLDVGWSFFGTISGNSVERENCIVGCDNFTIQAYGGEGINNIMPYNVKTIKEDSLSGKGTANIFYNFRVRLIK